MESELRYRGDNKQKGPRLSKDVRYAGKNECVWVYIYLRGCLYGEGKSTTHFTNMLCSLHFEILILSTAVNKTHLRKHAHVNV